MNKLFIYNDITKGDISKDIISKFTEKLKDNSIDVIANSYDSYNEKLTLEVIDNLNRTENELFELKTKIKQEVYKSIN